MATHPIPIETLNRRRISLLILFFCCILLFTAFIVDSPARLWQGELLIITSPGILITDYAALAGPGAALLNAALVTLIALGIAYYVKARFDGFLLAAVFTVAGFSFFGKNPFNIWPVMLGVGLFNRLFIHQPLKELIVPLLLSTTISPLVSQVIFGFGFGWLGIPLGIAIGILAGALLLALAKHIFTFHLGYNLYNIGTTGGFVAMAIFIFMRGFGLEVKPQLFWSSQHTGLFTLLTVGFLITVIVLGFVWGGGWKRLQGILKCKGLPPVDYVREFGLGTALTNMGIVGLIALGYIHFVGGDVNGATLAGIFTVFGFGALGENPRNILPVMFGIYLICFIKIWSHTDPGPLLAALFCTTLAPFVSRFGFWAGLLAGALHLPMVMHVGSLHGYMNLYNNGFAGGLAMIIIIGVIKAIRPDLLEN